MEAQQETRRARLLPPDGPVAPGRGAGGDGPGAVGGALASVTSDAVSYLTLAAVCVVTLMVLSGYRETTAPVAAER